MAAQVGRPFYVSQTMDSTFLSDAYAGAAAAPACVILGVRPSLRWVAWSCGLGSYLVASSPLDEMIRAVCDWRR